MPTVLRKQMSSTKKLAQFWKKPLRIIFYLLLVYIRLHAFEQGLVTASKPCKCYAGAAQRTWIFGLT